MAKHQKRKTQKSALLEAPSERLKLQPSNCVAGKKKHKKFKKSKKKQKGHSSSSRNSPKTTSNSQSLIQSDVLSQNTSKQLVDTGQQKVTSPLLPTPARDNQLQKNLSLLSEGKGDIQQRPAAVDVVEPGSVESSSTVAVDFLSAYQTSGHTDRMFNQGYYRNYPYNGNERDFSTDDWDPNNFNNFENYTGNWPNPWEATSYGSQHDQNWAYRSKKGRKKEQYQSSRNHPKSNWNVWLAGDVPKSQSAGKQKSAARPSWVNNGEGSNNRSGGRFDDKWDQFTRQFGDKHFHRDGADSLNSSTDFRFVMSDNSGLEDSGSSGGGKKRPRSLDRESKLTKSSRAERPNKPDSGFLNPNDSHDLSLSDLNGSETQEPDSASRQRKVYKAQELLSNKGSSARPKTGLLMATVAAGRKKTGAAKHKGLPGGPASKGLSREEPGRGEKEDGGSTEGVLERAERMCQELREKRQQASHVRSASSSQRVAALRSALNTSSRRFHSAQKSFIKGYLSDSSPVAVEPADSYSSAASLVQRKHFSSSLELPTATRTVDAPVTSDLGDSQSSAAGASVSSSSSHADIERIRHSIESSVLAQSRTERPESRTERPESRTERPTSRDRSSDSVNGTRRAEKPANVRQRSQSGHEPSPSSISTSTSKVRLSTSTNKPPLPLSKDALTKMVNSPRTRFQRVQLSRILRENTGASAVTRTRPIHLEGLYDNAKDSDSIQDVLNNISGLEEIGDCAELQNIKLEDLTVEDKLRIAQLIEESDVVDRDPHPVDTEARKELPRQSESHSPVKIWINNAATLGGGSEAPLSPQRPHARSPTPSQPLSLDDLNTSTSQLEPLAVRPALIRSRSPSPNLRSPIRSRSVRSPSPTRSALATSFGNHVDSDDASGPMDVSSSQVTRVASPSQVSGRSSVDPKEVSDLSHLRSQTVKGASEVPPSRATGVLHEVMLLCQRQDTTTAEMRDIDTELSQMYKSLIEIVARMSSLQRRRVQLQVETEDLSVRRNQMLTGLVPQADLCVSTSLQRESEVSGSHTGNRPSVSSDRPDSRPPVGSSVTLPSWLTGVSSNRHMEASQKQAPAAAAAESQSDVCLSGSVTSSVDSATPLAGSLAASQNVSAVAGFDGMQDIGDDHEPPMRRSSSRGMLSINGVVNTSLGGSVKEGDASVVPHSLVEVSQSVPKSCAAADSSSGVGSSMSTRSSGELTSKETGQRDYTSQLSNTQLSSTHQSSTASSVGREQDLQPSHTPQPSEPGRLLLSSFASPPHPQSGANIPKSPGIGVAYLGALSSELVQQIVRNLPLTSQLGESHAPGMYMLKPGTAPVGQAQGATSSTGDGQSRTRTISTHSDASAGDQASSVTVPPLKLNEDSDRAGSKNCTPRSESDAHSVASGTSLGEQIKLFSERNSSSSLSFINAEDGTTEADSFSLQDLGSCSVQLTKLDLDKIDKASPETWKVEDDDTDRPRKRKSKKDRDQSLHRRRRYLVDSSSEAEELRERAMAAGEGEDEGAGSFQDVMEKEYESESKMEGEEGEAELDSTLVDSAEYISSEDLHTVRDQQSASALEPSASRFKLDPNNLKAFQSNVRRHLTPSASETSLKDKDSSSVNSTVAKKNCLRICGPSAPVMGFHLHGKLLYIGFKGLGVNSYTLAGQLCDEYSVPTARCFTLAPVGSGSQHHLVVGSEDQLTFLSTGDRSVVAVLDTGLQVMCLLVVDATIYAGLDTGLVIAFSLTTLRESHRFQACDSSVHAMTWTREGNTRLLCVASQDTFIHIIDSNSRLPIRVIGGHTKTAFALCMLDHFLLSGSGDRTVQAHNVHTAESVWELNDHKGIITSLCVDNGLLFSAGFDKVIRCYNLKSRRLLYLLYGAGKSVVMQMTIHNSVLYTGNRDGAVEALDLTHIGRFTCKCKSCPAVYGLKEHLWHHVVADHLLPNSQDMQCPWADCPAMLNTVSALVKAGEHMRTHIDGS